MTPTLSPHEWLQQQLFAVPIKGGGPALYRVLESCIRRHFDGQADADDTLQAFVVYLLTMLDRRREMGDGLPEEADARGFILGSLRRFLSGAAG
jgi:hypothetical protein